MPRKARSTSLETRSARLRLAPRRAPYFVRIAKGVRLGYYRGTAPAGSWIARQYAGKGKYRTTAIGVADDTLDADGVNVFDFDEAQAAAREWTEIVRREAAGARRSGLYTVRHAVEEYLAEITAEKPERAVRDARYTFDSAILPVLGDQEVGRLNATIIKKWRDGLVVAPKQSRGRKTGTPKSDKSSVARPETDDALRKRRARANRVLTMLKAALTRAFSNEYVATDEAWRRVKPFPRVDQPVQRYLTPEEAWRLMNAADLDLRQLIKVALLTGARYSELAGMTCADFNADSGTIAIHTGRKGKPRHAVLTDEGRRLIGALVAGRVGKERLLLRSNGKSWRQSDQQRPMEEASDRAGIDPRVTFHILRHTHGSLLAMNGAPMRVIADQLGHADTRMTERHYAHLSPRYVADMVRSSLPDFGIVDDETAPVSLDNARRKARGG